jgi:hypothetical protein
MRQQQSGSGYAAGTRIDSQRSRAELASLLSRYGADDFAILEHDANATIRFALHGKYVQYVLPLPDLDSPEFSHTPTGRPRALTAQERAYEQAVRQQWRRAVLVVKGKLEAVESGLSTFEREFFGAIQDEERRDRPPALLLRRRLRWAPETMLLILCLGVLVPAGGAVALGVPAVAVERLAAPVLGSEPDPLGASEQKASASEGQALRLGSDVPASNDLAPSPRTTTTGSVAIASVKPGGTSSDPVVLGRSPEAAGPKLEPGAAGNSKGAGATGGGWHGEKPKGDKPKGDKPNGGKPGKPNKTESNGGKQAKPNDSKDDKKQGKPKSDSNPAAAGKAQQNDVGSNQGAGKDKDKSKDNGTEKGGKGAGGATSAKK